MINLDYEVVNGKIKVSALFKNYLENRGFKVFVTENNEVFFNWLNADEDDRFITDLFAFVHDNEPYKSMPYADIVQIDDTDEHEVETTFLPTPKIKLYDITADNKIKLDALSALYIQSLGLEWAINAEGKIQVASKDTSQFINTYRVNYVNYLNYVNDSYHTVSFMGELLKTESYDKVLELANTEIEIDVSAIVSEFEHNKAEANKAEANKTEVNKGMFSSYFEWIFGNGTSPEGLKPKSANTPDTPKPQM